MLFSSITFLYLFLPFTILLYFFVPQKGRNFVLFVMSILFYAWGEPVYVLLMLAQIVISYVLLWFVDRFRGRRAAGIFYLFFCRLRHCFTLNILSFLWRHCLASRQRQLHFRSVFHSIRFRSQVTVLMCTAAGWSDRKILSPMRRM